MSDLLEQFRGRLPGTLPGLLGLELLAAERGRVEARLDIRSDLLAPNGFLHAGTVVTLADSCCGMGCQLTLPEGASGFTTVELKANFLRTAREGAALGCVATVVHEGSTTQVWDATVSRESDSKVLGLFRCTQYLLRDGLRAPAG
jgi:uncharacterized protein (TIGR00369 family)